MYKSKREARSLNSFLSCGVQYSSSFSRYRYKDLLPFPLLYENDYSILKSENTIIGSVSRDSVVIFN